MDTSVSWGFKLFQKSNPRLINNNFDLLRFLFSAIVLLVHSYQLSGFQELAGIEVLLSSSVAVKSFFVVSGFLIFMSFERSKSTADYFGKRIRRIYPAYFAVIIIFALGLVLISSKNVNEYFSLSWVRYIVSNLTFMNYLQPTLPGVFESNKLAAVNGALWTLKVEVMFYLSVPFIVFLFRKYSHISVLMIFYGLSVAYAEFFAIVAERTGSGKFAELGHQLPGQLSYFMAGAFIFYFLPLFERRIWFFVIAAIFILAMNIYFPMPALEPFAIASIVIYFALFLYAGNFGRYGDFSYGIYILHFPVIQILLYSGWFHKSPWFFLMTVILVTICGAIALWHLVEKQFLFRKVNPA